MKSLNKHFEQVQKNKRLIDRVEHCQENNGELNDWEDSFLDSVAEQLTEGRSLSDRQLEKLEQIEYVVEWGRDEEYWGNYS